MSRFASASAAKSAPDVFTAIAGVACLILILGCVWLVMHNLDFSSSKQGSGDGGIFKVLD
ncbi:MAG: hypothetical protein P8I91_06965 [Phycisphaerales bacterium]|jgi:hypothetical protein|nr:hypothetical protein [Phycisphaerales bacterium]